MKNMKDGEVFTKYLNTLNFHYYDKALLICEKILQNNSQNKTALQLKSQIIELRNF